MLGLREIVLHKISIMNVNGCALFSIEECVGGRTVLLKSHSGDGESETLRCL